MQSSSHVGEVKVPCEPAGFLPTKSTFPQVREVSPVPQVSAYFPLCQTLSSTASTGQVAQTLKMELAEPALLSRPL